MVALSAFALAAYAALGDPCQPVRIPPPAVVPPVDFGANVAVDGNFWFISDVNARVLCPGDPFNCSSGAVHVYEMVDGHLEFRQMLTAPEPRIGEFYGHGLDANSGRLVVGTLHTNWPDREAVGGVFVYEYDEERWVLTGTIRPPEGIDRFYSSLFGAHVAIEGDALYAHPLDRPQVFVHRLQDGEWTFVQMVETPDGLPKQANFGISIAPNEPWVFISAVRDSSLTPFGGSVYAYRREPDGTLTFVQKIVPTDAPGGAEMNVGFGSGVSYDGQTLAIGAYGAFRDGAEHGAVLLFDLVGGVWTFQQEATHPATGDANLLGDQVEVNGDVLLARASRQRSSTASSALHLFRRGIDGVWCHADKLVPNPPIFASGYAGSIATDGRAVLAGAVNDFDGTSLTTGAAYVFDLASCGCAVDLDADGALTIFDFLAFFNAFDAGDPIADFNGDGEFTIFDFLAFQTAFDAGCG